MKKNLKIVLVLFYSITLHANSVFKNPYTSQIVISSPGEYRLEEDVAVAPRTSNSAMILIAASNVQLDLNGKSIGISTTSFTPIRAGIQVTNGAENVTICNGTINGQGTQTTALTSTGVYGFRNNNLTIKNLTINQCTSNGILLDRSSNTKIDHIDLSKCRSNGIRLKTSNRGSVNFLTCDSMLSGTAINATSCNKWTVKNSTIKNSINTHLQGILLNSCTGFECHNVEIINNSGSGTKRGIDLFSSTYNSFRHCSFKNNISTDSPVKGFRCDTSSNLNCFEKCFADQNTNGVNDYPIILYHNAGGDYNTFDGCTALDNTSTTTIFCFLSELIGFGTIFKSCEAINNQCGLTGGAYGFVSIQDYNLQILYCNASYNGNFSDEITGNRSIAIGIALLGALNYHSINNNLIMGNRGIQAQYGFADFGYLTTIPGAATISAGAGILNFSSNVSLFHGPSKTFGAQSASRANFYETGGITSSITEVQIRESSQVSQVFPCLLSSDPTKNISIYITPATTLT